MKNQSKPEQAAKRKAYEKPKLSRWGKLRDLTHGGGGRNGEPATKRKTRF